MKILTITLVVIILFSFAFLGFFYYSLRATEEMATTLQATTTANSFLMGSAPEISPSATPANLRGPVSKPTMRGPSGPPPNY